MTTYENVPPSTAVANAIVSEDAVYVKIPSLEPPPSNALSVLAEFATRTEPFAIVAKPVQRYHTGNATVTVAVRAIEPANIAFVIPDAFTLNASELTSIEESSTATFNVLPDFVSASPATT